MPFHLSPLRRFQSVAIPVQPPRALQLLRHVVPLQAGEPLTKAIHRLRAENLTAIPVATGETLLGWVTAKRVAALLSDGAADARDLSVCDATDSLPAVVEPLSSPEDIVRLLRDTGCESLPVIFANGRYEGCVTLSDALAAQAGQHAPPRLGGMATPLGVYLTSGTVSGGAGFWGLLSAGALMAFMLWIVQNVIYYNAVLLYSATAWPFFALIAGVLSAEAASTTPMLAFGAYVVTLLLVMAGFLTLLRYGPRMAGLHAAEHQTVNAIEAGEPLTPEAIGKMSRVHPRCGTNLWGFMSLTYLGVALLAISLSTPFGRQNLPLVTAFVFWYVLTIIMNWRHFGGWMQQHLTTRMATPAELASGVRAGKEVLHRHLARGGMPPHRLQRIWHMGLIQVILGAILMTWLLEALAWALDYFIHSLVK